MERRYQYNEYIPRFIPGITVNAEKMHGHALQTIEITKNRSCTGLVQDLQR